MRGHAPQDISLVNLRDVPTYPPFKAFKLPHSPSQLSLLGSARQEGPKTHTCKKIIQQRITNTLLLGGHVCACMVACCKDQITQQDEFL